MDMNDFIKARIRFTEAKTTFVKATTEFEEAKTEYSTILNSINNIIETEKDTLGLTPIGTQRTLLPAPVKSPLLSSPVIIESVVAKTSVTQISSVNPNVLNAEERTFWDKKIKPAIKDVNKVCIESGINRVTALNWFNNHNYPSKKNFEKLMVWFKSNV